MPKRTPKKEGDSKANVNKSYILQPLALCLFSLLLFSTIVNFYLVSIHPEVSNNNAAIASNSGFKYKRRAAVSPNSGNVNVDASQAHLFPKFPVLPIFAPIPDGKRLAQLTLEGQPTMAGVLQILQTFVTALHESNIKRTRPELADEMDVINSYFKLTKEYLSPLEEAYHGKNIFPVREDESIYVSLAAFREHLLAQTLQSAFDQAANPEKLFIGAIVQNCFGNDGRQCKTGWQVVGKNAQGKDQVKMSDAPPDENGIETFCKKNAQNQKFCDNGQIRVLYIHDTDALGPAAARFYASKLWGGETYFMQMDAHLEFAHHWDARYIAEVRAAKNYPKAVLSAYPPGFSEFGEYKGGTPGARLCTCEFSTNGVEEHIIRIGIGGSTPKGAPAPTQIAFIAAGFFFAHGRFLGDVPFDPYVPWCFMGEEIALSMRAWTAGWDIYAPRENLIAHQYRPGRMGLPKFWESVGRDSGRPGLNTRLQKHVLRRIKHMVGYETDTVQAITAAGDAIVLTDFERYGLGTERKKEDYLKLTEIDVQNMRCGNMQWCTKATLP